MKTLKFIVFGLALSMAPAIQSQITFGVQIGVAPAWGPAGYSDTRYYYLPDVEAYYDVQTSMFIYNDGGVWVRRGHLPERYRDYDLYGGYKVVMNDYRGESPYSHFNEHRSRYGRGYHRDGQRTIGERPHRDNHEAKIMHEEKHENKEVRHDNERRNDQGNKVGGHENEKKVSNDNGKHETHDNGKNKNEDHGKDSKDDHGHDGGRR
jgi:hypothetical protein